MKTYRYFLNIIVCMLFLCACSEKDTEPVLTRVDSSSLNALPFQSIVLSQPAELSSPLLCTVTWTGTQFYFDDSTSPLPAGPVSYTLEIAKVNENFAAAQSLAVTNSLYADLLIKDINKLLIEKFEVQPGDTFDAEIRVVATYGEGLAKSVVSSNTVKLSITTYKEEQEVPVLKRIYICGNMNGWDNTNTDFMMFRDDSDPTNEVYTYTGRIEAGCYFKFCPEESLGTYKMYCDNGAGQVSYEDRGDGSFFNEIEGYKTITLNLKEMTCTITDYDMSQAKEWEMINFVGDFCGWGADDADPAMTQSAYDPHIWNLALNIDNPGYGVKFRVSHSWDNRWCPFVPTDIPYGKAEYNPTSQDNNISIQEAGDYYVKFNDLTGHYIVMLQK
ncbi:SusE domain-containing protein [uncultured Bacteroides sp.]|uniref:SusE domain-containing protein n=1 Tax=uncultured Bacteroides sp. TaxID=162156 RepID=UPI002AA6CFA8|nr:SusF/SusE family outer membrane protein [uncultured Bacteroides sp.]